MARDTVTEASAKLVDIPRGWRVIYCHILLNDALSGRNVSH